MGRVVIHIGAMKSGTSYLQSCLYANKTHLPEQGLRLAADSFGGQVAAAVNLRGKQRTQGGLDAAGAWERIVRQCHEYDGTTLISVELLARLRAPRIRSIAADFADLPVDIVVTLRDLNRTIPAMWQETIQNGRMWTWDDYVAEVRETRPTAEGRPWLKGGEQSVPRTFWSNHDADAIVDRWSHATSDGTVKVVTVPPPGERPELLLERFGAAVGFDPSGFEEAPRSNSSLGVPSTEALRLMNLELDDRGLAFPFAIKVRKANLAKALLVRRARQEPRIAFPVEPWLARTAEQQVRGLQASGAELYGAWSDLDPVPLPEGIDPTEVRTEDVAAAAVDGYGMLRTRLGEIRTGELPPPWQAAGSAQQVLRDGTAALADLVEWSERGDVGHGTR
jgi:hypothetical protein